jgi:hypothetical protein
MSFSLTRKHRVGPFIFLLRQGYGSSDGFRLSSPVHGRRLNAPDVSLLFQGDSHQPELTFCSQRNAVRNPRWSARSSGKLVEQHGQSRFQRLIEAHAASLCVYHQSMAVLAEGSCRIQAGKAKRDLRPNSGTAPCRFDRFRTRAHMRTLFDCTARPNLSFIGGCSDLKPK